MQYNLIKLEENEDWLIYQVNVTWDFQTATNRFDLKTVATFEVPKDITTYKLDRITSKQTTILKHKNPLAVYDQLKIDKQTDNIIFRILDKEFLNGN